MIVGGRDSRKTKWLLTVTTGGILIIIVIGLLLYFTTFTTSQVKNDAYQLVKLTNGETYFGKLKHTKGDFIMLNDAYVQAEQKNDKEEATDLIITKLSATVVKPEDTIYIAKDQVMYWENLQPDSKIMNAISSQ